MKTKFGVMSILPVVLAVLVACQVAVAPSTISAPPGKAEARPQGEEKWDKLVTEAKKEERVVIYGSPNPPDFRTALGAAFKKRYGLDLEWVIGRGAEIVPRIEAERRAGLYLPDVGILGSTTYFNNVEPLDITIPVAPLLMLPEVTDLKMWPDGKLPLLDGPGHSFPLSMFSMPTIIINTDLVKPEEIQSTAALINPKWKGKMVMDDPTISGNGNQWYVFTLNYILGMDKGREFMKTLVRDNYITALTRDHRTLTEWVSRGKYSIGLGVSPAVPPEFMKAGAPIQFIDLKEPRPMSTGWGLLNVFKNAPHPKAAQVFANWMLTREGLSIFVQGSNYPSPRLDVPKESILPIMIPRPGDILTGTKEYEALKARMMKTAVEDFASLVK
ncbi:MAG: extracellular solute-binding protein [Chloroflexi bacterium]|nr:extracellular solute-binding protein [Chloroflexota bacterium]